MASEDGPHGKGKATAAPTVVPVFSTPVVMRDWPDAAAMNAELQQTILARADRGDGMRRSNIGGWQSGTDLMTWPDPAVAMFRDCLMKVVPDLLKLSLTEAARQRKYDLSVVAWANVLRDGGYHAAHDHPRSHWSGVYYISAGQPDGDSPMNGQLELFDPRLGVAMAGPQGSAFATPCLLETRPGRMIFFPGWLRHMVHPFRGTGVRISISYNLSFRAVA